MLQTDRSLDKANCGQEELVEMTLEEQVEVAEAYTGKKMLKEVEKLNQKTTFAFRGKISMEALRSLNSLVTK